MNGIKLMNFKYIGCLLLAGLSPAVWTHSAAAVSPDESRPRLAIAAGAVVKGERITVGEIAKIESREPAYAELVQRLTAVDLGTAPAPMARTTLAGLRILELIEQAGIPRDALAYSIPQAVTVERAGREITNAEVIEAIRNTLVREQGLDLQVKEVSWSSPYLVPIGGSEIQIERLGRASSGRLPIRVSVDVNGAPATRFLATAIVDDWRAVPILNRTVERGELIEPTDISIVRMNMAEQPADLADDDESVVGKRTKARINAGAAVRRSQIDLPPTIAKGQKVMMIYDAGGLHVTAIGIALEDGVTGSDINLKNETSGKTIRARIIGESRVKVN